MIVNIHNKKIGKESDRLTKIRECIETKSWSNLPDMDSDNITPNGRTSNQIILDWFTTQTNCNKYLGATDDITKKTSGVTKEGVRVQICNIIFEELGKLSFSLIKSKGILNDILTTLIFFSSQESFEKRQK